MLPNDIANYAKQFEFEPVIQNAAKMPKPGKGRSFVVCGMGGSHLAANLIHAWHPELDIVIHPDYGLPLLRESDLKERFFIISSYSGNTEETIDAMNAARAKHLHFAIIAARGKLIGFAEKNKIPYVQLPDLHCQPRMALGVSMLAMLAIMGEKGLLAEAKELARILRPAAEELRGKDLAKRLYGSVPVVYASSRNAAIAQNWKIKFNETGKIPSFYNVVPELNHNEMTGFDVKPKTIPLSRNFQFLFLKDGEDDRRIIKRMNVLEKLYRDRMFKAEVVLLQGKNRIHKLMNGLVLADWTAYFTAKMYSVEPEQVPMVEEFKKLIGR